MFLDTQAGISFPVEATALVTFCKQNILLACLVKAIAQLSMYAIFVETRQAAIILGNFHGINYFSTRNLTSNLSSVL